AASVPRCSITAKNRPPPVGTPRIASNAASATARCPLLETGRNSVRPWITARVSASNQLMGRGGSREGRGGRGGSGGRPLLPEVGRRDHEVLDGTIDRQQHRGPEQKVSGDDHPPRRVVAQGEHEQRGDDRGALE